MRDQLRPQDTQAWLEMLFTPKDIFEVRVKELDQSGTQQHWLHYGGHAQKFIDQHIPIHTDAQRHIWVGVAPRAAKGSTVPARHRALWVDFDATITSVEDAKMHIELADLPPATMLVWSGNGVHAYWALQSWPKPDVARPYLRALHENLPSDATHDPTRIMRVPGTWNFKDPDDPKLCYIAEHYPERTYPLERFPKMRAPDPVDAGAKPRTMTPLSDEDRDLFLSRWIDGDKHQMVLAVAGYLRKNLFYDEASALAEIKRIHQMAGHEPDEQLERSVRDTYKQMWAKVAGSERLRQLGVIPSVRGGPVIKFGKPKKRRIEVIDFNQHQHDQEFWVHGLIGPGLLTIWAGGPKTGKSFAAMQMGYALATGTQLWDFETTEKRLRVLYFQGELSRGMVYSRAKSMFGLGSIQNPRQYAMTAKPNEPIDLVADPEPLYDLAEHYDAVIIDPISIFTRNDESKSHNVNEVVGVFDPLRADGKAVVLIHHTRKLQNDKDGNPIRPNFNDIRGSSAWFGLGDALAIHYRVGKDRNTRAEFEFRAAGDRDPLDLYRLPTGGFTHDKETYLQYQRPLTFSVASALN